MIKTIDNKYDGVIIDNKTLHMHAICLREESGKKQQNLL